MGQSFIFFFYLIVICFCNKLRYPYLLNKIPPYFYFLPLGPDFVLFEVLTFDSYSFYPVSLWYFFLLVYSQSSPSTSSSIVSPVWFSNKSFFPHRLNLHRFCNSHYFWSFIGKVLNLSHHRNCSSQSHVTPRLRSDLTSPIFSLHSFVSISYCIIKVCKPNFSFISFFC